MTNRDRALVSRIEKLAARVQSFVASYELTMVYATTSIYSKGRLYYAGKHHFRVEGITNGQKVITVSSEDVTETFFVQQKLISQKNTIPDQSPIDLLHGLSDIRDVFISVDRDSLECRGERSVADRITYMFKGSFPVLTIPENIRVRMPIDVELYVDKETCLLVRRVWTTRKGQKLVHADYTLEQTNVELPESCFRLDISDPQVKRVATMDISKILFFSDDLSQGASMN